ncbi:MAG TPA: nucleotidyltransferase domain-containing protein [Kiritimatiellia bacterium]|nr:nucleotidyltransferase domain-containing protein [Kiritimatiellia bacterium]HPS08181.1 nucleotidyltransferase domain-containing protein [Kiritimatiellia bacterium]
MRHLSEAWLKAYLQTVTSLFGVRLLFVGLQGSYGRDEATESSDIDMALILDLVSAQDLKAYDDAISKLPHREKMCGFISGKQELACWSKADLFQFCHDTTPLAGSLRDLLPEIGEDDIRRAILTGACNIYHLCGHNMVHEKDPAILKSLYKAAVFVVQALHYHRMGVYLKKRCELLTEAPQREQQLLLAYARIKDSRPDQDVDVASSSELLFAWAGQVIREYGSAQ